MTEFLSGRKIDKPIRGLMDYIGKRAEDYPKEVAQGWKNAFGIGEPVPIGSMDQPIAESVGGLSISPAAFSKAIGKGYSALQKSYNPLKGGLQYYPTVQNVRNMGDVGRFLPKSALKPVGKVTTKRKIKSPYKHDASGNEVVIKGRNERYVGSKESDIIYTPQSDTVTGIHEVDHAHMNALRRTNTPQGERADILETISEESAKFKRGSKEAHKEYSSRLNELHARNLSKDVMSRMYDTVLKHGRTKLKSGKLRMSDKEWNKLSDTHTKKILKDYEKANPAKYKRIKDKVRLIRKNDAKVQKLVDKMNKKKPGSTTVEQEKFFSGLDEASPRFPDKVGSWEEASKLGGEFPAKELNRVMLKERKLSEGLTKQAKAAPDDKMGEIFFQSQEHALRSQGAREALESQYIKSLGGKYSPNYRFKPAKFQAWVTKQLKK